MPVLNLAAARPETDVDGFGEREDFAEGGDVDGLHGDSLWGLVEGAVERVVEDVGLRLDGAWDAVSGVFVLEFEGVGGVVGIGDFTADVGDDDGDGAAIWLDDVGVWREEELGVMGTFFLGEHGGFYLVFVGGMIVVECGGAEKGGGGAVDDIEGLGEKAPVDGELKERAFDEKARGDADGGDDVVVGREVGNIGGDNVLVSEADGARRELAIDEDETFGVALEGAAGEDEVCEVLDGGARDGER